MDMQLKKFLSHAEVGMAFDNALRDAHKAIEDGAEHYYWSIELTGDKIITQNKIPKGERT